MFPARELWAAGWANSQPQRVAVGGEVGGAFGGPRDNVKDDRVAVVVLVHAGCWLGPSWRGSPSATVMCMTSVVMPRSSSLISRSRPAALNSQAALGTHTAHDITPCVGVDAPEVERDGRCGAVVGIGEHGVFRYADSGNMAATAPGRSSAGRPAKAA